MTRHRRHSPLAWATPAIAGVLGIAPAGPTGNAAAAPRGRPSNEGSVRASALPTASQREAVPADAGSPADGQPSPQDLIKANTLAAMSPMREALEKAFPTAFGGMYNQDGKAAFVVEIVDSNKADDIKSFVANYIHSANPSDTAPPPVTYALASVPLSQLHQVKAKVMNDLGSWSSKGEPIYGAGINDKSNRVQVYIPERSSAEQYQRAFSEAYGMDAFEFSATPAPQSTDRINDTPPWKGGDQIVLGSGPMRGTGCTSGFGAHDPSGSRYMLTAGHCTRGGTGPNYKWYNTSFYSPNYSPSRFMGQPDGQAYTSGYDTERMPTSTSNVFWKQSATREVLATDAGPSVGNGVCLEGSFGLERCGQVGAIDQSAYFGDLGITLNGLFTIPGAPPIPGDSGGPVVWITGYGYIAQGTITGFSGSTGLSTGINYDESFLGVRVNSLSSP